MSEDRSRLAYAGNRGEAFAVWRVRSSRSRVLPLTLKEGPLVSGAARRACRHAVQVGRNDTRHAVPTLILSGLHPSTCCSPGRVRGKIYGVGRDLLIPDRPVCKFPLN
jgi:hypothetical protein